MIFAVASYWDWVVKPLLSVVKYVWDAIRSVGDSLINYLCSALASAFPTVNWTPFNGMLANINSFFPLAELITYSLTLLSVYLLVVLYRMVKSWIPTVSGT